MRLLLCYLQSVLDLFVARIIVKVLDICRNSVKVLDNLKTRDQNLSVNVTIVKSFVF